MSKWCSPDGDPEAEWIEAEAESIASEIRADPETEFGVWFNPFDDIDGAKRLKSEGMLTALLWSGNQGDLNVMRKKWRQIDRYIAEAVEKEARRRAEIRWEDKECEIGPEDET